ncbi:MAG: tetratricopeptide repeat protein [Candidatus Omnitrophica bacterium]|nr:tetratricopeptide repeat protein [Candidatus Omnitrophota bacterium]
MKIKYLIFVAVFFLAVSAMAENVVLRSGKVIQGDVIERTDDYIKINFEGIPLTYYFGDIDNIDGKKILGIPYDSETIVVGVTDGSPEATIVFWKTAIEREPNNVNAYYHVGNAYVELLDYERALEFFKKTVSVDPNFVLGYRDIGLTYLSLEKYFEAIPYLEKAIKLSPESKEMASAYHSLGANQLRAGNFAEAEPYLRKAIELDPDFYTAYMNLGGMYAQLGEYDKAKEWIEKSLDINGSFADAYFNLANVNLWLDDTPSAKDNLLKARDLYEQQGNIEGVERVNSYFQ